MPDISSIILSGTGNPWLFLPAAVLLGILHALEPGHSKSLMAAFIIAIRGTPMQAVMLGVSAAVGHTIIVWLLAALGIYLGDKLIVETAEPWLILISGLLIILLAVRLILTLRKKSNAEQSHHDHDHDHDHGHDHIHDHAHAHVHHDDEDEDAHAAAHQREIEQRFAGRQNITTFEILWFGFTGGLLPCPASVTVLLVCLQLKKFTLGMAMVAAFSVGLAITLVAVGMVAAWGTKKAAASFSGFSVWSKRLPYISGALVFALGIFITVRGLIALGLFVTA